jgi:hypothetical protein
MKIKKLGDYIIINNLLDTKKNLFLFTYNKVIIINLS